MLETCILLAEVRLHWCIGDPKKGHKNGSGGQQDPGLEKLYGCSSIMVLVHLYT